MAERQTGRRGALPHKRHGYEEGSLDQYLRDISIYPLITREQEVELAQRIRADDQEALDTLVRGRPLVVYYSYAPDSTHAFDWLTRVRWQRFGERVR